MFFCVVSFVVAWGEKPGYACKQNDDYSSNSTVKNLSACKMKCNQQTGCKFVTYKEGLCQLNRKCTGTKNDTDPLTRKVYERIGI